MNRPPERGRLCIFIFFWSSGKQQVKIKVSREGRRHRRTGSRWNLAGSLTDESGVLRTYYYTPTGRSSVSGGITQQHFFFMRAKKGQFSPHPKHTHNKHINRSASLFTRGTGTPHHVHAKYGCAATAVHLALVNEFVWDLRVGRVLFWNFVVVVVTASKAMP